MKNLAQGCVALAIYLAAVSCKEEAASDASSNAAASSTASAPAAATAVVDAEIANAAKAVTRAAQGATPDAENGPPEDGILGKERAMAELPPGAPPKVVVGKLGDAPRVKLGGPPLSAARPGQMTLSVRTGPRTALPTVDLGLELTSGSKADDALPTLRIAVSGAKLNEQQPGALPPSLAAGLTTLTGSFFDYALSDSGAAVTSKLSLSKGAVPGLAGILEAAADGLAPIAIAYPEEPLGQGAIWMVTAREQFSATEVISYHLYEVTELLAGQAVLSVKTQRYLVEPVVAGSPAMRFTSSGSGDWVVLPGKRIPVEGRMQQSLQALVQGADGEPQPVQWDLRALYAFPLPGVAPAPSAPVLNAIPQAPRTTAPPSQPTP